uniref:helix-turn-helix transcriptional regulator n=1 Tax=Halegenticoccus soli TaxID=1985678 RepID=UPI000C6E6239|nr:hypothetical protein [Halegenticoccus soli]
MDDTAAAAAAATGREMAIENVSVSAEIRQLPREYGVVVYRFEWIGFAAVDGDRLVVGDALDGFFLDPGSRLLISWPAGYALGDVSPPPDERRETAVVWDGPTDFGGQPRLVVADGGSPVSLPVLLAAALALVGGVSAVWWTRRRHDGRLRLRGDAARRPAGRKSTADGQSSAAGRSDANGGAGGRERGGGESGGGDDGPPPELLSNEERVLRLLERNGGRMKQQTVVSELGWTEARTSQVVSGLRDEGKLESFRIGRENVLKLPEEESDA